MTTNKTYKTTTPSGVRALLRDRHYFGSLREKGDTMASDILIDLDRAMNLAKITDRPDAGLGSGGIRRHARGGKSTDVDGK